MADGSPADGVAAASEFLDQSGRSIERPIGHRRPHGDGSDRRVTGKVVSIFPGLSLTIEVDGRGPVERVTP